MSLRMIIKYFDEDHSFTFELIPIFYWTPVIIGIVVTLVIIIIENSILFIIKIYDYNKNIAKHTRLISEFKNEH